MHSLRFQCEIWSVRCKQYSIVMRSWLVCVLLWTSLPSESRASWLRGKPGNDLFSGSNLAAFRGSCAGSPLQATCWCGEGPDRRQTIIYVKQCPYSTAWGSQCEPCTPPQELCQRLEHCARCHQYNPDAVCADCPPDRYGMLCEKERPCKTPNITEHMTVHPYFNRKGVYKLEFRCTGGRVREGPKAIRCMNNSGIWNREPPKCVQPMRCSSLPTDPIPFTRVKQDSHRLERVIYECDVGYTTVGNVLETALQCENGVWVQIGESVRCEPSPKCTTLLSYHGARIKVGTPVKSVYHAGETVQYECEDAFRPVPGRSDNFTLTCSGKHWHGQAPECELKGCKRLTIEHGGVVYSAESNSNQSDYLPLNTIVHATCHKAYTLENPQKVTCSESGEWSPSAPKCVPKACEDLERGKMCSVNVSVNDVIPETNRTEIYPGQVVKFKCKEGSFRKLKVGQAERICFHNGTLSGSGIECSPVQVCTVVLPPEDRHVKYCRGKNCNKTGRDLFRDRTYDFPPNVVPMFGQVGFFCDSKYYCLDGQHSLQCLPGMIVSELRAPRCKPVCGVRKFPKEPRIMGGQASRIEAWPWQAALLEARWKQAEFICGATLIDDKWAVTAAHCVTVENTTMVRDAKYMRLTYGLSSSSESRRHAANSKEEKYKVARIIVHKDYNGRSLHGDIALLELKTPAEIGYHVGVACLPLADKHLMGGEQGIVTGWGRTETERLSDDLRELPLTVVNASQCRQHYKDLGINGEVVTDGMFCAVSNSTVEDTTDGDSGGPFVVQDDDGHWVLEGIVSWGAPDNKEQDSINRRAHIRLSKGEPLLPTCRGLPCFGGYTHVAKYVQWIREQTGGEVGFRRCG